MKKYQYTWDGRNAAGGGITLVWWYVDHFTIYLARIGGIGSNHQLGVFNPHIVYSMFVITDWDHVLQIRLPPGQNQSVTKFSTRQLDRTQGREGLGTRIQMMVRNFCDLLLPQSSPHSKAYNILTDTVHYTGWTCWVLPSFIYDFIWAHPFMGNDEPGNFPSIKPLPQSLMRYTGTQTFTPVNFLLEKFKIYKEFHTTRAVMIHNLL